MKKKLMTVLLAVLMCVGTFAVPVSAADDDVMKYAPNTVITPMFEEVTVMVDGIAGVKLGEKWGYIDENSKILVTPRYDIAYPMQNGTALVGYARPTAEGEDPAYNLYVVNKNGIEKQLKIDASKYYLGEMLAEKNGVDSDGKTPMVLQFDPETEDMYDYVHIGNGFIVIDGEYLFKNDGTPIVVQDPWGQLSYTDGTSRTVYNRYLFFEAGECVDGIIPMYAEYAPTTYPPIAFLMTLDGYIVRKSEPMRMPLSENDTLTNQEGIIRVWQPIDGYTVFAASEYDIYSVDSSVVMFGVLNSMGQIAVQPIYTDVVSTNGMPIVNGMLCLRNMNGRYGIVRVDGTTVIPFLYDYMQMMENGFAVGYIGNEQFIIDMKHTIYRIADENGKEVAVADIGEMMDNGTRMIVTTDNRTFLIDDQPTDGVFTALRGTEKANIVAGDGEAGKYWVIENGNQAGFIKLELEKYIDLATYEPDSLIVNVIVKLLRGMENMFVWRP